MRQRGLSARGLENVLGLRCPTPARLDLHEWIDGEGPLAAVPVMLFCGRRRLPRDLVERCFGDDTVALESIGLLELDGESALATLAVLPVGESLAVSRWDRLPDDSSLHLCGALPSRVHSWLDIGTGAAFAPLFAPHLAPAIVGTDIDSDGLELAKIGLALSGIEHVDLQPGDLFAIDDPPSPPALITFNAPVTSDLRSLMTRFWEQAASATAPGGEVLVHCRVDVVIPDEMPGDVVVARYTPDDTEAFAIVRWHPDRPNHRRQLTVELDEVSAHVRRDWISSGDTR